MTTMGPFRLTTIPTWTAFHPVPVIVTIVLLWLNIHGMYTGGELSGNIGQDEWKLFGLELATLTFYLLVLASVWHLNSTMSHAWNDQHWRVLSGDTQVPDRSESLAPSSCLVRLTSGLLLLFCLSVMLLAPRAMIPELRNWDGGGTTFWLTLTRADLWPLRLDEKKVSLLPRWQYLPFTQYRRVRRPAIRQIMRLSDYCAHLSKESK